MNNITRLKLDPPHSWIAEADVSSQRLASLLDAAVIECEFDDEGALYAREGLDFPVGVTIEGPKKLITLTACATLTNLAGQSIFANINTANCEVGLVQFTWEAEAVWGYYWLTFAGGVDAKQFVRTLRSFASSFNTGVKTVVKAEGRLSLSI